MKNSLLKFIAIFTILATLLSACAPAVTPTPVVIEKQVEVTKLVEATKLVETTKIVETTKLVEATKLVEVPAATVKPVIVRVTNAPLPNDQTQVTRQKFLLEQFKQAHPEIIIDATPYQYDVQTFAARFAAGGMEDTFLVSFTEPGKLIQSKYVADISAIVKDEAILKSIKPEFLKLAQDKDGKLYGLPGYANVLGLMYRRDLFVKAGLDAEKPPQTWEELEADCKIIKEKLTDTSCFGVRNTGDLGGWMSFAIQASFGGANETQSADGKWTATYNNDGMVKALTEWQKLYTAGYMPKSLSWGHMEQVQDFAAGKVVMTIADGGTLNWMAANMSKDFKLEDVGLGRLPNGGANASLGGGWVWLYNAKSSPEALKAAVQWNIWRDFDLATYEQDLKARFDAKTFVGFPEVNIFTGDYATKRAEIIKKYTNVPSQNYKNYNDSVVLPVAEPPLEAGKMKVELGQLVQKILTNKSADVKALLDASVKKFQTDVLDKVK